MKKRKSEKAKSWNTAAKDMLYLIRCSLHAEVPALERVLKMDLQKVYSLSRSQSLDAMTYFALERLSKVTDALQQQETAQILKQWAESRNKTIRNTMLMDAERTQLFAYMEAHGIWHLPLKGVILSKMYPEYGMRQMADNDILFDESFRQEIHDWFKTRGYEVKSFQKSNHDEYHRAPVYNFEMHTSLFDESQIQFSEYYQDLKNRLALVQGKQFEYHMIDEDFYLYFLAHAYKHYSAGGTGIRTLLDLFVYNSAKEEMDQFYLKQELKKLGLEEFEEKMKQLAFRLFISESDERKLTIDEQKLLKSLFLAHTYGTKTYIWNRDLEKMQPEGSEMTIAIKWHYILRRLFPRWNALEQWCETHEPFFLRHKWLMPLAYPWRIVKKRKKDIAKEFDTIRKL